MKNNAKLLFFLLILFISISISSVYAENSSATDVSEDIYSEDIYSEDIYSEDIYSEDMYSEVVSMKMDKINERELDVKDLDIPDKKDEGDVNTTINKKIDDPSFSEKEAILTTTIFLTLSAPSQVNAGERFSMSLSASGNGRLPVDGYGIISFCGQSKSVSLSGYSSAYFTAPSTAGYYDAIAYYGHDGSSIYHYVSANSPTRRIIVVGSSSGTNINSGSSNIDYRETPDLIFNASKTNILKDEVVQFSGIFRPDGRMNFNYWDIIISKDSEYITTLKTSTDGSFSIKIRFNGLNSSKIYNFAIDAKFNGSQFYRPVNTTVNVCVDARKSNVLTVNSNIRDDGRVLISGQLKDENGKKIENQNITVQIKTNGKLYGQGTTKTGKDGTYNITGLFGEGNYTVTAIYNGSSNYVNSTNQTNIVVKKKKTTITIDEIKSPIFNNTIKITGKLIDSGGKSCNYAIVEINILNETYYNRTNSNGVYTLYYTPTRIGTFNVIATFDGNISFLNSTTKTKFNVKITSPLYTYIKLNDISDVEYGRYRTIRGYYFYSNDVPLIQTTMRININGVTYTSKTDNEGYFTYDYRANRVGKNTVTVSYPGNTNFKQASVTKNFNVKITSPIYTYIILNNIKEVTKGQITTISGYYYYSDNIPLTQTNMRININGQAYTTKTDNNGYFTYNYKTTKDGSNTVTVSYPGNTNFKSATDTKTFNVKSLGPQYTYISLNNIQDVAYGGYIIISGHYYYGNDIPLTYTNMRLNINGEQVLVKTDNSGYFTYTYKTSRVGKNTVTVSYPGNTNFKQASVTKNFNVKITSPIYTYIILNNIKEVTKGQITTISGYYYYSDNIPLTYTNMRLNINGEQVLVKTDNSGYFTYTYKTNMVGINTVVASYPGNTNFKSATITKTFRVI